MKKYLLVFTTLFVAAGFVGCSKSTDAPSGTTNAPTVQTTAISSYSATTAVAGGNVTSDGGATVTAKGVCWSTSPNPTISSSTTNDGTGTGSYVSNITGLTANTTYYVCAYATNSVGTNYGAQTSFVTSAQALAIGQNYAGGIIFYLDGTGQHGYVVAASDQSTGTPWNPNSGNASNYHPVTTGATSQALGGGSSNTDKIIATIGNGNNAASVCRNYNGGGYSDWYLPDVNEWSFITTNVFGTITPNVYYWTSSEITQNGVPNCYHLWTGPATDPKTIDGDEYDNLSVRAVRAF